jgi:membrane protein YqaA with SNARE-associated domain
MLRRLYDWTMRLSAGPNALVALAVVSFVESSFFPIPPDILMIPMILAAPRRAWLIASVCTLSSVAGGFLGYAIGHFLFDTVGQPVLEFYGAMDKYAAVKRTFDEWGAWFIIVKGATPIPYKIVTIFSGAVHFDLLQFTLSSIVSRAMRFFLLAALLWKFGEPIRHFIDHHLTAVTTGAAVLVVGGFFLVKYVF